MDCDSMTVQELKKELRARGLKLNGRKSELKKRLKAALEAQAIEESANAASDDHDHDESEDHDKEQQQTDFADFEEYINDEYNRLNKDNNSEQVDPEQVNIDDIINDHKEDQVEEEKNILFIPETPKGPKSSTVIIGADFSEDPKALNNRSKVEDRRNRFGTAPISDSDKLESRKRRFADHGTNDNEFNPSPPAKKQRIDPKQERSKILQRAQKFGTSLPKNFKLTKEESAVIHADKINRAKRFGTEHLLPSALKKAEFAAKKEERMKRFKVDQDESEEVETSKVPKNIIKADKEPNNSTKLMERKLRFGTLKEIETKKNDFGPKNKKKVNNKRQLRNNQKFERFRAYKKKNRNNKRGGFGGRGRGKQRGRGYKYNNNRNYNGNNRNFNNYNYDNVQFNAEDQQKVNQRRLRFSGIM